MEFSRRQLLRFGGAGSAAVLVGTAAVSSARFAAPRRLGDDPFTLGVASGDPTSDGVVLWTRLAPDPLAPDGRGGMMWDPVSVDYEVAHDERFRQVVARGSAVATRELGHSVHPEISGLEPDRWYFYRFRAGSAISPTGRTRTTPEPGRPTARMRFAFASCQSFPSGYFTAYDHMSAEDLDLVVHLGDYIYERGWQWGRLESPLDPAYRDEVTDLAGYRLRYAQAKSESPLRAAHAAFPWLITMDDHEVDNNWAGDHPGAGIDIYRVPALFRRRRAAAFQAMYEHQPLRLTQLPSGSHITLHRRYAYGDLGEITMIDTRQYRNEPACEDGILGGGCDRDSADRTILGARQRNWLLDGFSSSPARWQIIGNQVAMARSDYDPGPGVDLSGDAWDGYVADRDLVLGGAADRGVRNLVVITGDRHHNYAADLRRDYSRPDSPVVATEFTGTSITSGGDGSDMTDTGRALLAANPDLKFFNGQRGYVRVELDQQLLRSDFRVVPYIRQRGAPIRTRASYVVQDRIPGVIEASHPETPSDARPGSPPPGSGPR
ncbi:alkaline phosphatase D family protein [Nocardia jejuensis]|uniref:alkaline phosphatase D family protein n=1 Tax=Nocardia jejuensis TaxID=328049 RepID=UPI000834208A|nr:alkaline phosphatase D family protein [Nocardia jejuensis]